MKHKFKLLGAALAIATSSVAANATIVTIFDDVAGGKANFNTTVTTAGGTATVDTLTSVVGGTSVNRGDYTITSNDGGYLGWTSYGTLSGLATSIDPAGGGSDPRTDPTDYFGSGITLTFGSAVNSIGFEVGDWATCCFNPTTDLYISFDNGAPIQVASASSLMEGLFPSQVTGNSVNEIFVAAFDDSGSFTTVSFWGNGIGEYLLFGGEVHYALLDEGTLPPSAVPVPASGLLLLGALGGIAALRRRRGAARA